MRIKYWAGKMDRNPGYLNSEYNYKFLPNRWSRFESYREMLSYESFFEFHDGNGFHPRNLLLEKDGENVFEWLKTNLIGKAHLWINHSVRINILKAGFPCEVIQQATIRFSQTADAVKFKLICG